jgi:hypothetical protein
MGIRQIFSMHEAEMIRWQPKVYFVSKDQNSGCDCVAVDAGTILSQNGDEVSAWTLRRKNCPDIAGK